MWARGIKAAWRGHEAQKMTQRGGFEPLVPLQQSRAQAENVQPMASSGGDRPLCHTRPSARWFPISDPFPPVTALQISISQLPVWLRHRTCVQVFEKAVFQSGRACSRFFWSHQQHASIEFISMAQMMPNSAINIYFNQVCGPCHLHQPWRPNSNQ
ncbi:hypothetical protein J1614_001637 [Plenodomus biglobosus]|nr:hypothetical protein J1614_001637 [Plenodomus biglobosus]